MTPSTWQQRFFARFDDAFLRAPDTSVSALAGPPAHPVNNAVATLLATQGPFAAARFVVNRDDEPRPSVHLQQALDWRLLQLDGTHHMLGLGGPLAQRLHRLRVKVAETWGREPAVPGGAGGASRPDAWAGHAHRPWDCGYVRPGPQAAGLAARFSPRRHSLLVVWHWALADSLAMEQALQTQAAHFCHPVRLLVVAGAEARV